MSDILDKLSASRVEHQNYRRASQQSNRVAAKAAIQKAYDLRIAAHHADPDHADPAWDAEAIQYPHAALVAFYEDQLSR